MRDGLAMAALAAALFVPGAAGAQALVIDESTTALRDVGGQAAMSVNLVTGAVFVKAATGSACSLAPQPTVVVTAPTTATSGQTVAVSWSASNTAGGAPCTPSSFPVNASWNQGASGPSGTRNVTLPTVAAGNVINQQLTMTCSGASGTTPAVDTKVIAVSGGGGGTNCAGTPTDGLVVAGFPSDWGNLHPGFNFPAPLGNTRLVSVESGFVAAIAFQTGSSISGSVETSEGSGIAGGPLRISISRCPGDFRPALRVGQRCATVGTSVQQQLFFSSTASNSGICTLQPNTQYYLNLTFRVASIAAGEPGGPVQGGDCGDASCGALVVTRSLTRAEEQAHGIAEGK